MDKLKVFDKIETVLDKAEAVGRKALAPHEFEDILVFDSEGRPDSGRAFVGCSESALGRRLREMREIGRVSSKTRAGEAFKEYSRVKKTAPAVA